MCDVCEESVGYLGGVMLSVCTLPQLWQMISTKSAGDLQKKFLLLYLAGSLLTFIYLVLKNAWAAWVTMTLEIFLTICTLGYKIYLDNHNNTEQSHSADAIMSNVKDEFHDIEISITPSMSFSGHAYSSLQDSDVCDEKNTLTFQASHLKGLNILLDYSGVFAQNPSSGWLQLEVDKALKNFNICSVHCHTQTFSMEGFSFVCILDNQCLFTASFKAKGSGGLSVSGALTITTFSFDKDVNKMFGATKKIHSAIMSYNENVQFLGSCTFCSPQ